MTIINGIQMVMNSDKTCEVSGHSMLQPHKGSLRFGYDYEDGCVLSAAPHGGRMPHEVSSWVKASDGGLKPDATIVVIAEGKPPASAPAGFAALALTGPALADPPTYTCKCILRYTYIYLYIYRHIRNNRNNV